MGPESEARLQLSDSDRYLQAGRGVSGASHYVENNQITQKQQFPFTVTKTQITANGTDESVITGIPQGTKVEWPDRIRGR